MTIEIVDDPSDPSVILTAALSERCHKEDVVNVIEASMNLLCRSIALTAAEAKSPGDSLREANAMIDDLMGGLRESVVHMLTERFPTEGSA